MSRADEGAVQRTAADQNKTFNTNAQDAFEGANDSLIKQQGDVGDFSGQLSKFAAANPYGRGGDFETSSNLITSNASDAAARAAASAAQAGAVRTGLNSAGGVAAGIAADQAGTRDLAAEQARLNQQRISGGADYGAKVLTASEVPATLQGAITGEQSKMAGQEGELAEGALGIDQKASDDPNFGDTLGTAFAQSLGKFAGGSK